MHATLEAPIEDSAEHEGPAPAQPPAKTRKPVAPAPRQHPGPDNSIVYAIYDTTLDSWLYTCMGEHGITAQYPSSRLARTAYARREF